MCEIKRRSLEEFITQLEKTPYYKETEYEILSVDSQSNCFQKAMVKTEHGILEIPCSKLLKGLPFSTQQIINKKSYFLSKLEKDKPNLFKNIISIGDFKNLKDKVVVETIYGNCLVEVASLNRIEEVSIMSAINKNDFWIRRAKSLVTISKDVSYEECNYENNKKQVSLKCTIHNYKYTQRPSHHMANVQGCPPTVLYQL